MAETPVPPAPPTSELVRSFDLYRVNRPLWLQIEADKKRIRDAKIAVIMKFETGQAIPTFALFRKLPYELRNAIWRLAALESRVVEVIAIEGRDKIGRPRVYFVSATLVPAIMHTCYESRKAGLKVYKQFKWHGERIDGAGAFLQTYVNFDLDIILLETKQTLRRFNMKNIPRTWATLLLSSSSAMTRELTEQCKHLAVTGIDAETLPERFKSGLVFKKLKTLYVINRYRQDTSSTATGNITFTDAPEGSHALGFSDFQLSMVSFKHKLGGINMKTSPVVKGVDAHRDGNKLMSESDRLRQEKREEQEHKKEQLSLERSEGEERVDEAVFDDLGAEITDFGGDDASGDEGDFEELEDGYGDGAEMDDDPDASYAAELQARLDRGEDIDDVYA